MLNNLSSQLRLLLVAFSAAVPLYAFSAVHYIWDIWNLEARGDYALGYLYRNGNGRSMPIGWTGGFDVNSGVAFRQIGTYRGKSASLLHCPWRGGTGVSFQEFTLNIPLAKSIRLTGATAMQGGASAKSDGATFRIFANGKRLLQRHQTAVDWDEFNIDLTAYAGEQVQIRFETDPGPADNAGFDFSLWGSRRIDVKGFSAPATEVEFKPLDPQKLQSEAPDSVVPWVVDRVPGKWTANASTGTFRYSGPSGSFVVTVDGRDVSEEAFPAIQLTHGQATGKTQILRIPKPVILNWTRPVSSKRTHVQLIGDELVVRRDYADAKGMSAIVRSSLRVVNKSLVIEVSSTKPWVNEVATSGWQPEVLRVLVPVPYYGGQIALLPRMGWFANYFFDWTRSTASALSGNLAKYASLTDGNRNLLQERIVYSFANDLEEVFPHVPNPPSPYRKIVAERTFLDAWGGRFAEVQSRLTRLAPWGLSNCVLLVHDWQRSGYDNALPAHFPAAVSGGGEAAFGELMAASKQAGCLVAAHENYADLYPNFEGFRTDDAALDSSGKPQKAWLNTGTGVQSYAMRPNAMMKHAATQAPEVARRYGTNAAFLDVNSSMPPWFHVDMRASEPGAGQFSQVFRENARLWSQMRVWHGGPVFGEGAEHWYWAGLLDGVEAQPGAGWELGEGDSVPLAVGFSLLKLHPLQVDHGMGYYHRWSNKVLAKERPSDALLDRYRMQEVAFAHAAYLGSTTWDTGWDFWMEHNLVPPVVKRATQSGVSSIVFWVDGQWVSMSAAAWAESWVAVKVTYRNGLEVIANSSSLPLNLDGQTISPSGWLARGAGLLAWSDDQGSKRSDYSADDDTVFANAMRSAQTNLTGESSRELTVFPRIATNGSVKVSRVSGGWKLHSAPNGIPMTVRLDAKFFGPFIGMQCDRKPIGQAGLEFGNSAWQLSVVGGTVCTWPRECPHEDCEQVILRGL